MPGRKCSARQSSRLYADPHDHKSFLSEVKNKKSLKDVELKLRNKRGEMIYGLETANTMVDKDGKMSGVQGIIRDITAKKKHEETLALLQTAIDASSEAVLISDRSGTIVYGNPAVEAMTGYGVLEIVGRNVEFLGSGVPKDEKDQPPVGDDPGRELVGGRVPQPAQGRHDLLPARHHFPGARQRRGDQPFREHRLRHHHGKEARGADDPGRQDGLPRAAGQRHRPRLQQLPDHHQRLLRDAARRERERQGEREP